MEVITYVLSDTIHVPRAQQDRRLAGRALLGTIDNGMREALDECQSQFQWDRWACPESAFDVIANHGKLPGARWSWGGCSVDIKHAGNFSRHVLIDKFGANKDLNAAMHTHNNKVGTAAVRKTTQRTCRCHGPSGTCTMKTCWMKLGEMSAVGRRLRKAYDRAHLVHSNRGAPKWPEVKKVLVYAVPSGNYCRTNRSLDIGGTYGRECSRRTGRGVSRTERDSCYNLCQSCGHSVRKVTVITKHKCNCQFQWCCTVKCDICYGNATKYICQ
ncbi:hypothetical protein MTO96_003743 [Rhipicephalus appendiculatus]